MKTNSRIYITDLCGNRDHYIGFTNDDGKMFLERCPECLAENWAMAVASGVCAWCGFEWKGSKQEKDLLKEVK